MNKEDVIEKLKEFQNEIRGCYNIKELRIITDRLRRKLQEIYNDNDPFIKRCHVQQEGIKRKN